MAAATPTVQALTGDWVIDKSKSENIDGALKLQGIGWLRRKAVTSGTITLKVAQNTDTSSQPQKMNVMMQQGLRGIFPGVEQTRALDWTEHEHVDAVSGAKIFVKSRFVKGLRDGEKMKPVLSVESEVPAKEKAGAEEFLAAPVAGAVPVDGEGEGLEKAFVQDLIRCPDGGWTAEQVWAVTASGDGARLVCKAVAVKDSSLEQACQVYQLAEQQ
ncbi:hypothetical protein BDV18DRAFT_159900 [Aspergillus unguis]